MEIFDSSKMIGGWFIGDFSPTVIKTKDFEVGVKIYNADVYQREKPHFHKIVTEVTFIVEGSAKVNNQIVHAGQIILVHPCEVVDFEPLSTKLITVVAKFPSVIGDKFFSD